MNAICVTIDRFHVGHLGAYGNGWIETPNFDRLACEGVVADRFLLNAPTSDAFHRSAWTGRHPLAPPSESPTVFDELDGHGVRSILLTDSARAAESGRRVESLATHLLPSASATRLVESPEDAHLIHAFAEVADAADTAEGPFLLWAHIESLAKAWDAPLEFRDQYADPDDPAPDASAAVPCVQLEPGYDPDDVLRAAHAYAGQVSLLDHCLGGLMATLEMAAPGEETLLLVAGSRGFPLGEHGRVGPCDDPLYAETYHAPLFLRLPDMIGGSVRANDLIEPADLYATLRDWFGLPVEKTPRDARSARSLLPIAREFDDRPSRDRIVHVAEDGSPALTTQAWFLRPRDSQLVLPFPGAGTESSHVMTEAEAAARGLTHALYAKPHDRWEVNDVADRCTDVVDRMADTLDETVETIRAESDEALPSLDALLVEGL